MLTTIRYILLTASRDFLFFGLLLAVVVATALSAVLGSTALVEGLSMTLSFASTAARIVLLLGLMIFVCFHLRQAFEQKEIDVLLSRPLSRAKIVLSYWLGFSLVAFLLVLASVMVLSFLSLSGLTGFAVWSGSLLLEALLVVAMAMFAAFTLRSAVSAVLATLGFYVLGRLMGFFMLIVDSHISLGDATITQWAKGLVAGISMVIPRLDLFGQSEWLVYGIAQYNELLMAALQMAVYIPLLLAAATIDFIRKEF